MNGNKFFWLEWDPSVLGFFGRVYVLTSIAIPLVIALGPGGRRFSQLAIVVVLQVAVKAVGFNESGVAVKAEGFVGEGFCEKEFPDRARDVAAVGRSIVEVNKAFIAANPGAGQELGGITHEP